MKEEENSSHIKKILETHIYSNFSMKERENSLKAKNATYLVFHSAFHDDKGGVSEFK